MFDNSDDTEEALNKQLYEAATRAPLTQVLDRRAFDQRLAVECAHSRGHRTPLSLVLCDIDRFKKVNDQYGHPTGDRVLQEIVRRVLRSIRMEDVFARYAEVARRRRRSSRSPTSASTEHCTRDAIASARSPDARAPAR